MFCPNCGEAVPEGSGFCPGCGTALSEADAGMQQPVTERITRFSDGKYRWQRPVDLLKNGSQLKLVLRITGILCFLISIAICLDTGAGSLTVPLILLVTGGGLVTAFLIYTVAVTLMGRKFAMLYEMDGTTIAMSRQMGQAQDLRWTVAGYVLGRVSRPDMALQSFYLLADHDRTLQIDTVRTLRWEEKRGCLKLSGSFGSFRVYLAGEDRALLERHIRTHCPELRNIR